MPLASCGECYYRLRGLRHLCTKMGCVGLSWDGGGMAEYTVLNDYHANKLPDTVSDKQGALIEPAAVALYAVDRGGVAVEIERADHERGPDRRAGRARLPCGRCVEDLRERPQPRARREMAGFGVASQIFDPSDGELPQKIRDLTEGVGVRRRDRMRGEPACAECMRGRRTLSGRRRAGGPACGRRGSVDPMQWSLKDIRIEGTWCYPVTIWPRIIGMIANGKFPVEKLIHDLIDADDVVSPKGFDVLSDKRQRQDEDSDQPSSTIARNTALEIAHD